MREQHFKTLLRMVLNLPVGLQTVEIFSVMTADRDGLYHLSPSWWAEYECPYLFSFRRLFLFAYYRGLFFRGNAEDIRWVITLEIF